MKLTLVMARHKAKLSQSEMAKKLGISTAAYSRYEKYQQYMRVDLAAMFCEVVGVSLDDVIFFNV